MRILLVEDDESIREVFRMILETEQPVAGLIVETACNGADAITQVRAQRPDLVLLDLTLEGEDGFEVFRKLHSLENCSDLPVIAVTAHNLPEMQSQAQELGFAGFVTKPIDFESALFPLIRSINGARVHDAA